MASQRNRANYHKHCGVGQFHGCSCYGEDTIWGVVRQRKSVLYADVVIMTHYVEPVIMPGGSRGGFLSPG